MFLHQVALIGSLELFGLPPETISLSHERISMRVYGVFKGRRDGTELEHYVVSCKGAISLTNDHRSHLCTSSINGIVTASDSRKLLKRQ